MGRRRKVLSGKRIREALRKGRKWYGEDKDISED